MHRGSRKLRPILLVVLTAFALMLPMLVAPVAAQAATTTTTRIVSFAAAPASVVKGKSVTYSGQVQRASGKAWVKTGAVSLRVYFDPDGAAPNKLVKTMKTGSTGYFKSATVATVSGKWSVQLAAQGGYKGSSSAAKVVKVVAPKPVPKPAAATRIASFAAGPASVVKGKSVTYSGQVQRASGKTWVKTGAVSLRVYFDPDGAAPKKLVKTMKTGSTGYFKSTAVATVSGKWSVQLAAQGGYKGSSSAAKVVKVVAPKPVPKPSVTKPESKWNCPSWAPIKGNAPSKIYHMRGQSFYDKTTPEQCFATETAAVKAGYRKSKR